MINFWLKCYTAIFWEWGGWTEYWNDKRLIMVNRKPLFFSSGPNIQLPGTPWDTTVLKLADHAFTNQVFSFIFKRGHIHSYLFARQVGACLWQLCAIWFSRGSVACREQATSLSALLSDNQLWQGRHTCPRPNEQRRVKWAGGVDLPVPRWLPTTHPWTPFPCLSKLWPEVDTLTWPADLGQPPLTRGPDLAGETKSPSGGCQGVDGQLRPSKVSIARLARRSSNAYYKSQGNAFTVSRAPTGARWVPSPSKAQRFSSSLFHKSL